MTPAFPKPPTPAQQTGLILQRGADLVTLPNGGSPALSEMLSRSLVHLQASKTLTVPERIPGEECDLEIAPGVMMRMCWIPEGEPVMGSQLVTTRHKLKITGTAGKQRLTDATTAESHNVINNG